MLVLFLAMLSSASMALVLKLFRAQKGNRYGLLLGNYLTCERIKNSTRKLVTDDTVRKAELLVEFVSSETGEIISLCIEEKVVEVSFRGLYSRRLTGAQFLVNFKQS